MRRGHLTLIRGCMFSGKSRRLLDVLQAARTEGCTVAAFKHASDNRYAAAYIVTHDGRRMEAVAISDPAQILELAGTADCIGIDEAQFFSGQIVDVCRTLIERGRRVVAAGLDLDSWGQPFGPMPELAAIADEVVEVQGRCARCGAVATRTQRLAPVQGQKMVGGPESYEPRCAACFQPPPAELRR